MVLGVLETTCFTVFLRLGARETRVLDRFCALRVRWSVRVGATGRWGEPQGLVSEAPTRAVQRWCARDRLLGRASGSVFRRADPCVGALV